MWQTVKTEMVLASVKNPFDGVSPSWDVFGKEFDAKVVVILGGLWALFILACAVALIKNGAQWGWAKKNGQLVDGDQASDGFYTALKATAVVIGAPLIIGAIIWVMS